MESKLKNELAECQKLQERSVRLQRNLDDTLQWKTNLETTFCIRENDLEKKVKQLEADLRSTADIKLQLQNQISEILNREATIADVREAVDRLEQKNQNLTEQLSNCMRIAFFFSKLFLRFRPKTTNCWRCESNGRK